MKKNYYFLLGVASDATDDEIKTAFRRRAQELHPDHSGLASEPFLEIQEAYRVLSDPKTRLRYDQQRARPPSQPHFKKTASEPLVPEPITPAAEPLIPTHQIPGPGHVWILFRF